MYRLCLKCGIQGHTNKTCKNEVTSFGVVAFRHNTPDFEKGRMYPFHQTECKYHIDAEIHSNTFSCENELLYLLVERKDTIGFLNLVQGSYPDIEPYRGKKIIKFVSELTCEEREKLRLLTFDELWEIAKSDRRDYIKSEAKWRKLNIYYWLEKYPCNYQEADYIMPKGRLKYGENVQECALREFCEETGYTKFDIELTTIPYFEEHFVGTDGKKYKNVFFVAKVKKNAQVTVRLGEDVDQTKEVRNMGWFNLSECKCIMRNYHSDKVRILERVHQILSRPRFTNDLCFIPKHIID